MNDRLQLTEEFSAGAAHLRVDVYGGEPREHVLDDLSFMNYRLADVRISPEVTLADPDIIWRQDGEKEVTYDGHTVTFTGSWPAGPIQKVIVAVLALRMETVGLHPSHSAAVNYRGRTFLFLGGESNHGKSMGLIEAGVRGRAPGRVPDHGHRRRRPGRHRAPSTRSSSSGPRVRSGPTRPPPTRASRSSGARCHPGTCTRAPRTSISSSSPRSTATSIRRPVS